MTFVCGDILFAMVEVNPSNQIGLVARPT